MRSSSTRLCVPRFANFSTPDLVMSGPNFGWNLGPFLYTLSGTIGAIYTAVERGIPGISFSAGHEVQPPYYYVNATASAGLKDPATITGELAANLAQQLITNVKGGRILPLGYGVLASTFPTSPLSQTTPLSTHLSSKPE
jgi:5'-nucleotidase